MLHLLPIRLLLFVFAAAVAVLVVAAFYVGTLETSATTRSVMYVVRWASSLSLAAIIISYAVWRWIPGVQQFIFPYLGGTWEGEVRFRDKEGNRDRRSVKLEAKHTLFGIRLLLESDETTSKTLAVHAHKDPDFDRYKLYYVYLNERKEGVAGAGETYRGLAVVRYETAEAPSLVGEYFTETHRQGTLHLRQVAVTAFWKLWR